MSNVDLSKTNVSLVAFYGDKPPQLKSLIQKLHACLLDCELIQDKFIRRSLINLGYEAINSAYITNIPLEKILMEFEKKSFRLTNELLEEKTITTTELLSSIGESESCIKPVTKWNRKVNLRN